MSTLTSKGQITIPVEIRQRLALAVGDRLRWSVRGDGVIEIVRERHVPIERVAGMLGRSRRRINVEAMDDAIGEAVTASDRASRKHARLR